MTRSLEQKKKILLLQYRHCSKKQTVKVKMQKTAITLKNSRKFSAFNCVAKTFLKLRLAKVTYFNRNQCNYRKQYVVSPALLNRTIMSRFCIQFYKSLSNIKDKYDKLFRLSQDVSL